MKVKIIFSVVIILLVRVGSSYAQPPNLKFILVQGPEGKPLGHVRNIAQDPNGYIWLAAQNAKCVYRYDGINFKVFKHEDNNPNSLGGTTVNSVYADDTGLIWIGGAGLDQYNPANGIFKHYHHVPNDPNSLGSDAVSEHPVLKDRKGRLWIGTYNAGLDRLDIQTGKFTHYRHDPANPKSLSCDFVWDIYEDRQGTIWIATGMPWGGDPNDGGLNRLEDDGTFTRYRHDPNDPHSLVDNKVAAMYEDSRGVFWVGTGGDGLHTMDRKTGKFERYPFDPRNPKKLSRPPLKPNEGNDKINFITEDCMGAIWIGTEYSGMNRYDTATKKITHYEKSNGFPNAGSWNAFTSHEGAFWITTEQDSVYRVDPFYKPIPKIQTNGMVTTFLEDNDNLWVGVFGDGLVQFDAGKKIQRHFKHDPLDAASLPDDIVISLFQNNKDSIWVGTSLGVRILNKVTRKFSLFHKGEVIKDLPNTGVTQIDQDRNGMLWFSRYGGGLFIYNPKNQSYKHFLTNAEDSASISSNVIFRFLEDRSGVMWAAGMYGSGGAVNRYNAETGKFKHYLKGTTIYCLYEDSKTNLWAGTEKGLYQYNPKEDRFTNFFDPQSEINSFGIDDIIEDNEKNLWIKSSSAIIKIDPNTKENFIYSSRFGISPEGMHLLPFHKTASGQLWVGCDNGYYQFFPRELSVKTNFKIIITDISINSISLLPGDGAMEEPVEQVPHLDLKYDQNSVAFKFVGIDFREPERIRYFFMLEGYDREWREVKEKEEKKSSYLNLPEGKYVYRVEAFNRDGTKSEQVVRLNIYPPWWKTWWAYSAYGLLFSMLAFVGYRLQTERIIQREREKTHQKELAQAREIEKAYTELKATQAQLIQSEKMASLGELTAGIAHEIQNPLNFVNNFSEVNSELVDELEQELKAGKIEEATLLAKDIKENSHKINHHGKRAGDIVRGMLQHSRTSSGQKEMTDINALADEYLRLAYHGLRAKDKSFHAKFETDFDSSSTMANIMSQDVGRVILNLINNAFYAVTEKAKQNISGYEPTVIVSTKNINGKIEIKVKDNGNGIPQKIMDKIFQPFFTTKPSGQGTGLGLSLSYDIVKAHGGEIKVNTKEGQGTEFVIKLPTV